MATELSDDLNMRSSFYVACHDGDFEYVERNLPTMTLEEVNQLETYPYKNSALHTAVEHAHEDIVKLLLERGACRQQLNGKNQTPLQTVASETDNVMRQLFKRTTNTDENRYRYVTLNSHLEWNFKSNYYTSPNRLFILNNILRDVDDEDYPLDHCLNELLKYVKNAKELKDCEGMEQIDYFLQQAARESDLDYLIKAYTAQTQFFQRLNVQLTKHNEIYGYHEYLDWSNYFAAFVFGLNLKSQMKRPLGCLGVTYRGMRIRSSELALYEVGEVICNKTFLSTSENRQIAEVFSGWNDPKQEDEIAVICELHINNVGTGLDIEEISEFPDEKEVLIIPMSYFIVANVSFDEPKGNAEITMIEYVNDPDDEKNHPFHYPGLMWYKDISMKKQPIEDNHNEND